MYKWKCEVSDIISEMQDAQGNTIKDTQTLLYDSLVGGSTYHRVLITVPIGTFTGRTQKAILEQINSLRCDILPSPMFIGRPDFKWSKN